MNLNLTTEEKFQIEKTKKEFTAVFNENIKRQGAEELLKYLTESDFFTAPASSRYHCAFAGGLARHSLNVYYRLKKMLDAEYGAEREAKYNNETIAVVGLLHDLCKINYYSVDYRNVKNDFGNWEKVPYFSIREEFPYGHGEKSVFIINRYVDLSAEEALAINWHMGGFDERVKGGSRCISEAFAGYKLCVFVHIADIYATYIDEEQ